ncbi:hypothetical protein PC121_g24890, partial [Phytophthora cactorum]
MMRIRAAEELKLMTPIVRLPESYSVPMVGFRFSDVAAARRFIESRDALLGDLRSIPGVDDHTEFHLIRKKLDHPMVVAARFIHECAKWESNGEDMPGMAGCDGLVRYLVNIRIRLEHAEEIAIAIALRVAPALGLLPIDAVEHAHLHEDDDAAETESDAE